MKSLGRVWRWSRARLVGETARRNAGNRKERLRDYASSPDREPGVTHDAKRQKIVFEPFSGFAGAKPFLSFLILLSIIEKHHNRKKGVWIANAKGVCCQTT